ncbi:ejaculatory bulb-specific protein 3 [Diachasma alloeum]|uniref:Chemosensory protein 4 n=1 Tax=Diachasma alloeum TaxID=454923 RepID=A0A4E0RZ63_9HYME|nr:ejaculatory bulb-specific protein 3 [Diachasma alloeum]THK33221.1 chemosensory protein 4 [Diachasma alloeum]
MKIAVFVLLSCLVAVISARPDKYTTKWDNIDVDQILNNDRILNNYVNCLLEEGNCTAEGRELKSVLPDALETECEKCSRKQRDGSKKIIKFLVQNKQDLWEKLMDKYDEEKKYRGKYEDQARAEGIEIQS